MITVSDSSRADILGRFPAATNRVYRVYNGVDPNFSTNGEPEKADRPYFLSVGNNKPHKNLSLILDAYARFSSNHDGIDLVLTGTGPLPDQPLPPGIRALGYIDKNHLARLYRGSLALICASRYEGFGLPAVEAQASGTPVIASGIPVFLETLGTSATFFKQGEISDLVAAMKRLALNAHLRSDLGEKGIENASRFSFDACARETLAIYEAVAIGHISEKAGRQRKRRNAKEEPDK